ncbi:MAG: GYD domain-containing protein [Pirellulales bacterium]
MATFITTIKFTQQGIKSIGESAKRAAALKASAKKMGVKVKDIYWTLGDHDGVLIFEAQDDESATALLLHLGSMGNVHTATVRAFTAAELDQILAKSQT